MSSRPPNKICANQEKQNESHEPDVWPYLLYYRLLIVIFCLWRKESEITIYRYYKSQRLSLFVTKPQSRDNRRRSAVAFPSYPI